MTLTYKDPRDVIISAAHFHGRGREGWLHKPDDRFGGLVVRCSLKGNQGLTDRRYKQRKSSIVAKIAAVGCVTMKSVANR